MISFVPEQRNYNFKMLCVCFKCFCIIIILAGSKIIEKREEQRVYQYHTNYYGKMVPFFSVVDAIMRRIKWITRSFQWHSIEILNGKWSKRWAVWIGGTFIENHSSVHCALKYRQQLRKYPLFNCFSNASKHLKANAPPQTFKMGHRYLCYENIWIETVKKRHIFIVSPMLYWEK